MSTHPLALPASGAHAAALAVLLGLGVTGSAAAAMPVERPLPITVEALREGSGAVDGRASAMRALEHLRAGDIARADRELSLAGDKAPGAPETWAAREELLAAQTPWDLPERVETYRALWGSLPSDPAAALSLRSYAYRLASLAAMFAAALTALGMAAAAARCFHNDLRRASAHLLRSVMPRPFPWLLCATAAVMTESPAVAIAGAACIGALYLRGLRRLLIPLVALCIAASPLLLERADRLDSMVASDELYALRTISQHCSSEACRGSLRAASTHDDTGASGVALARALRGSSDPEDQAEAARLLTNPARLASLQRFASGDALGTTPAGLTAAWLHEMNERAASAPPTQLHTLPGLAGAVARLGGWLLGALVLQAGLLALFLRRDGLLSEVCGSCGAVCGTADLREGGHCHLCAETETASRDAEQRAVAGYRPGDRVAREAWTAAIGDLFCPGAGSFAVGLSAGSMLLMLLAATSAAVMLAPLPWWPTTAVAVGLLRGCAGALLVALWLLSAIRFARHLRSRGAQEVA